MYVRPRYAGPTASGGGWNDLCLLLNPGMGSGANKMTPARTRSQFSLYCVMGANLIMTGNLSTIDSDTLATWGNEVIAAACNVFARRAVHTRRCVAGCDRHQPGSARSAAPCAVVDNNHGSGRIIAGRIRPAGSDCVRVRRRASEAALELGRERHGCQPRGLHERQAVPHRRHH